MADTPTPPPREEEPMPREPAPETSLVKQPAEPRPATATPVEEPRFGRWMGSLWLYTLLRFAMFGALWGILLLLGLGGYLAALIALVLSVPLSLVLLSRPRAAVTRQLEARMNARHQHREDLDARLQGDD